MQNRIYPIWHRNKKIYYTDWSNLNDIAEAISTIKETTKFIVELGEYDLLEIIDVRGSYASSAVLKALKESARLTKPFSKKKVMLGLSGSKKVLLSIVNRFVDSSIIAMESVDEAKEWLVNEN